MEDNFGHYELILIFVDGYYAEVYRSSLSIYCRDRCFKNTALYFQNWLKFTILGIDFKDKQYQ